MDILEYQYKAGKIPARFYMQLNGKTAQENYITIQRERAKEYNREIQKQITTQIEKEIPEIIEKSLDKILKDLNNK